ncbi:MAG: response regulator [Desulfobacterales bacterium]|nr:response regulator [Desulfobacterales bacterium]
MEKILIVDDEDVLCELYSAELSSEGYEVITTCDAAGLMELIGQHRPDLIVLDIRMGEYDGLDILQDIRNTYYNKPVVLCTAYSSFKSDLRSIAADHYVVKSADLTELKIKINMALESNVSLLKEKRMKKIGRQGNDEVQKIGCG